ncbi:2701_t:CDS:2 [Funneliformis geosporum]|nr:2701_t:CDS:2 [Funneliformis geosporum]
MSTSEPSKTSDLRRDNESNETSSIDVETLSLEAESYISFKSKKSNSSVNSSIDSLSNSISKMSIASSFKEKKQKILKSVKNRLKNFNENMPRIDLHEIKTQEPAKAMYLVLTKIKESPYINSSSLFIITGKSLENKDRTGYIGTKFNEFPHWMQHDSIKDLLVGKPVKGLGTYRVLIKNMKNTNNESNIYKDINLKELEEMAEKEVGFNYKMSLATGYYIMGAKDLKTANLYPAEEMYKNATKWYRKAEMSGSIEAKLCLGYMYSIGFNISDYNPEKAKKLFKEVIKANENAENSNSSKETEKATTAKELARIAMRNIAILYHNSHVIKPFEWKNIIKNGMNDKIEAAKWFGKAVDFDGNNLYAKAKLGRILLIDNKDLDEDKKLKGITMMKEAAEGGLAVGQTLIGKFYENEGNYEEAIKFYYEAANQNRGYYSHVAQYRLKKLDVENHIHKDKNIIDIKKLYEKELNYYYCDDEAILENINYQL